jgi:NAD(P)-dependent dehydrogenase (short-subunit alcohol dehydrogenase family)
MPMFFRPGDGGSAADASSRVAIVTGSDSGIGKATAVQLAQDGFDVGVTWHRDEDGANSTAEEVRSLGRRAEVRQLDLSNLPQAADVIDELAEALGGVDVLVNNSGTSREGKALELSYDDWRHTLSVDLDGAFLCAQRAARRMVQQGRGGRIVNVTSVHEFKPITDGVAYVAAKHGLGGLTKQLAFELGKHQITVNSVAPGEVATPMTGQEDEDPRGKDRAKYPLGRPGDAREIASCIGWLCSEGAAWTTGASFVVDGGYMLVSPSSRPDERA